MPVRIQEQRFISERIETTYLKILTVDSVRE